MPFAIEKVMLPAFPKTAHLPYKPNSDRTDSVATESEAGIIFTHPINIEEKIDCASMGVVWKDGNPIVRNRDHILRKGFVKETAAKKQFASVWNWVYEKKEKFIQLSEMGSYSVYGEWCVAQHGIHYTGLPDWFIAYDIYDYEKNVFLSPPIARKMLSDLGFHIPHLFHQGIYDGDYESLEVLANKVSTLSTSKVEGIYIKVYDSGVITNRFKMVREDFKRGALWNPKVLQKNWKI